VAAPAPSSREATHDEPRWCRFKMRQVVFECVPDPERPGEVAPRRCLSRERVCAETHRCLYAGGAGDPFHGSI
jgi:hypothetical protein